MANEFGPASEYLVIGQRNTDPQALNIVTGKYRFSGDHFMPGKLYARILGSPYAHAKVTSINTSKAEALAGVKAVVTYKDILMWGDGTLTSWGQEVAAVAAVDEATAEAALDLIEVSYDILIPVIDPDEAMKPNSPLAGAFPAGNITPTTSALNRGDVAKGFTEADVVIEETTGYAHRHTQNHIEPESALGWWEGDHFFCWVATQGVFGQRAGAAEELKIPLNQVHVYCKGVGGAHGGKGQSAPEVVCAILSKKTGTPVALHLPRRIHQVCRRNHYGPKLKMKMGAKNDGTLTAIEANWWANGGRNGSRGDYDVVPSNTWKVANFKSDEWGVATNLGVGGGHRCLGHPDGGFLSDIVLEKMAARLKINPLAFRRKIFLPEGSPDQATGRPLNASGLLQCLEKAATAIDYSTKYHAPGEKTLPDGRLHGIGIHAHDDPHGGASGSRGIIINMNEDGTINFNSGGTRMMGGPSAQASIIAETIGVKFSDVRCADWGTSDTAAEGGGQSGSTLTSSLGSAAKQAADDVRTQLFAVAAGTGTGMLKVKPEDLEAKDGKIFLKADPTKFVTHRAVMAAISQPVIGKGTVWAATIRKPVGTFPVGTAGVARSACASAAEVAVDPDTGLVEILNFVAVSDVGRVIERTSCEGQIKAALPSQINKALYWDAIPDPLTGIPLTFDFIDDKTSTAMDVPEDKGQFFLLETIDANGPYGAHGMGEPGVVGSYACIINAINNAINKWIDERPATPITILKALGKG